MGFSNNHNEYTNNPLGNQKMPDARPQLASMFGCQPGGFLGILPIVRMCGVLQQNFVYCITSRAKCPSLW